MQAPIDLETDLSIVCEALAQRNGGAARIEINPESVEQDLARLVLGVMELLRQLMELRAVRLLDAGKLAEAQEEALGTTLMRAEAAIQQLATQFGLEPEDLSLDLGPLGRSI